MTEPDFFSETADALAGIELTEEGKRPQKEIEFVTDEERARELADPVRRQILRVLRTGIEDTQTNVCAAC